MSYEPFWETLKARGVTKYALIKKHGVSNGTLWSMKNGKPIETTTIEKLCKILSCNVQDIITYIPD